MHKLFAPADEVIRKALAKAEPDWLHSPSAFYYTLSSALFHYTDPNSLILAAYSEVSPTPKFPELALIQLLDFKLVEARKNKNFNIVNMLNVISDGFDYDTHDLYAMARKKLNDGPDIDEVPAMRVQAIDDLFESHPTFEPTNKAIKALKKVWIKGVAQDGKFKRFDAYATHTGLLKPVYILQPSQRHRRCRIHKDGRLVTGVFTGREVASDYIVVPHCAAKVINNYSANAFKELLKYLAGIKSAS